MINLRNYQQEAINKIKELTIGERGIVNIATGGGKTVIMAELARQIDGRILICVPSTELREQTIDKLKIICGANVSVGSVQGKLNEADKDIIVATRQSLTHCKSHRLEDIVANGDIKYIIIDEVHQAVEQSKTIIEKIGEKSIVVGFTATPYNKKLTNIFDKIIYERHLIKMIEENYLVQPRAIKVYTDTDISQVKTVGGEFVQKQLEDAVNNDDRNESIVKAYLDYAEDRQCIVYATGIDHANAITECFVNNGINAKSVDSTLDREARDNIINNFKQNKIKVLVNVSILTTGFDMPQLDSILIARPTQSKILYTQVIGRALRLAEHKKDALIIDMVDTTSRFDLVNIDSIFNVTFKNGESLEEAQERVEKANQEEKERIRLEQERQKQIELERLRLEAEEIDLFNSNIKNISEYSNLDWFEWYYQGDIYYILSLNINQDIMVRKEGIDFVAYTYKDKQLEEYLRNDNLKELVDDIDSMAYTHGSSFIYRNSSWKWDKPTDKQIKAIKGKRRVINKWDCHKFFKTRSLFFRMKDFEKIDI